MIFNTVVIKNLDSIDQSVVGKVLIPNEEYIIPDSQRMAISLNDSVLQRISSGILQIGDGSQFFTETNKQISWLMSNSQVTTLSPFASKTIGSKKLFTRVHGISETIILGSNNIDFTVPYGQAKFNALEIVNAEEGDSVGLKILDSSTGLISGIPYYTLNQFGFNLRLPTGFYVRESQYDADLFQGLIIRLEYSSIGPKTVGINIILHELKD